MSISGRCEQVIEFTRDLPESSQVDSEDESPMQLLVEFDIALAEPDVGIRYSFSEGHTLHDPKTGVRLLDLEKSLNDNDWDYIAEEIDNNYPF